MVSGAGVVGAGVVRAGGPRMARGATVRHCQKHMPSSGGNLRVLLPPLSLLLLVLLLLLYAAAAVSLSALSSRKYQNLSIH